MYGAKGTVPQNLMLRFCAFLALLALAAAVPVVSHPNPIANLVLLKNDPRAVCMDGTPSGYYIRPASTLEGQDKFIISLEGGGECVSEADCKGRAKSVLGSSKNWNSTTTLSQIQDEHCSFNADFCYWNQIFVKYCSGDLWTGQRSSPSPSSFNLSFNGHNNLVAVLDHLKQTMKLDDANIVVLTGDSAGGIGTWINLDFVGDYLNPKTRYFAVPIAGFYFPTYPYTGAGAAIGGVPFTPPSLAAYVSLWDSFVPTACVESVGEENKWKCLMANYSYETVKAPVFVVEAQTDKVQMILHDQIPSGEPSSLSPPLQTYISEWGKNMTQALHTLAEKRKDFGVFSPACYMHTEFLFEKPVIKEFSFYDAIVSWAFADGIAPRVLMDNCGTVCNPTCPKA